MIPFVPATDVLSQKKIFSMEDDKSKVIPELTSKIWNISTLKRNAIPFPCFKPFCIKRNIIVLNSIVTFCFLWLKKKFRLVYFLNKILHLSLAIIGKMIAMVNSVRVMASCDKPFARGTSLNGWLRFLVEHPMRTPPPKVK